MKRLNTIFFTGLLCFTSGYIAHEIAGQPGVNFAGLALATPTSHSPEPRLATPPAHDVEVLLAANTPLTPEQCIALRHHRDWIGYAIDEDDDHTNSDGYCHSAERTKAYHDFVEWIDTVC